MGGRGRGRGGAGAGRPGMLPRRFARRAEQGAAGAGSDADRDPRGRRRRPKRRLSQGSNPRPARGSAHPLGGAPPSRGGERSAEAPRGRGPRTPDPSGPRSARRSPAPLRAAGVAAGRGGAEGRPAGLLPPAGARRAAAGLARSPGTRAPAESPPRRAAPDSARRPQLASVPDRAARPRRLVPPSPGRGRGWAPAARGKLGRGRAGAPTLRPRGPRLPAAGRVRGLPPGSGALRRPRLRGDPAPATPRRRPVVKAASSASFPCPHFSVRPRPAGTLVLSLFLPPISTTLRDGGKAARLGLRACPRGCLGTERPAWSASGAPEPRECGKPGDPRSSPPLSAGSAVFLPLWRAVADQCWDAS